MKTITLTDDAYQRLWAWKADPKESFSKVVLKVVPKRGTLADLSAAIDRLPPLDERQARLMEESVRCANDWGAAPIEWTT